MSPEDVEGECNAHLYLVVRGQQGKVTIRCRLKPDHELPHRDEFERDGHPVVITWIVDERSILDDYPVKTRAQIMARYSEDRWNPENWGTVDVPNGDGNG